MGFAPVLYRCRMLAVERLTPEDLIAVARLCGTTLRGFIDRDWDTSAIGVDWTCRETLEHICSLGYAPVLATRGDLVWPPALMVRPDSSIHDLIGTLETMAIVLAEVARAAPEDVRAPHPAGIADAEGFLAMGI